ncbi:hypothetical protein CANARDRAFT_27852 [[Candida] arabinofermentans NRRL YB-2248]|uniref:SGNH hydrolase-type esterase domain-containing protein n=1 Tax=[Candida] arabinofermentans NRRL YB-2248 TaxID=983967 RepID=A0A1E4T1X9_9ASCO|nr:hypothetical protein CANARDRAFT_27852 [[Candida] arabinofermentans NRRL YB-2248]
MARKRENFVYDLSYPKFLLLGDSITERCYQQYPIKDYILDGYDKERKHSHETAPLNFSMGSQLQHDYVRRLDVINRGFSGYNSENMRYMIKNILKIEHDESYSKCALAYLFLGSNDAATGYPDMCEYEKFIENMKFIIGEIQKRSIKLILIGPTHHYAEDWETLNPKDVLDGIRRSMENNKKYANGIEELSKTYNLPFIDLFSAFDKYNEEHGPESTRELFIDGIHFNGGGYQILYDCINKCINEHYPQFSNEQLDMRLPSWEHFDFDMIKSL